MGIWFLYWLTGFWYVGVGQMDPNEHKLAGARFKLAKWLVEVLHTSANMSFSLESPVMTFRSKGQLKKVRNEIKTCMWKCKWWIFHGNIKLDLKSIFLVILFRMYLCRHFAFIYRGQYGDRKQSGIERGWQDGKVPWARTRVAQQCGSRGYPHSDLKFNF